MSGTIITTIGFSLLFVYGLTKLLDFYGIGINVYGSYIAFYIFLLITYFVLPSDYYTLQNN